MGAKPTTSADNIYYKCRKNAGKYNPKLSNREGASELLRLSSSSLEDYELYIRPPSAETVNLMADIYNAPQLRSHFCGNECPIGKMRVAPIEVKESDRVLIEIFNELKKLNGAGEDLMDIAADGVIDDSEKDRFYKQIDTIKNVHKLAEELIASYEISNRK